MPTLKEYMGQEVYDLLYTHNDSRGNLIEDLEEVYCCKDKDIPEEKVARLEELLTSVCTVENILVQMESAKLLAAWGSEKAIKYFERCVDSRIDKLGNLDPHRLHGYDTTYERIIDSLFQYYSRFAERDYIESKSYNGPLGENARKRIEYTFSSIIRISEEITMDLSSLVTRLRKRGWNEYLEVLRDCYIKICGRSSDDLSRQLNMKGLQEILKEWDPGFFRTN